MADSASPRLEKKTKRNLDSHSPVTPRSAPNVPSGGPRDLQVTPWSDTRSPNGLPRGLEDSARLPERVRSSKYNKNQWFFNDFLCHQGSPNTSSERAWEPLSTSQGVPWTTFGLPGAVQKVPQAPPRPPQGSPRASREHP